MKEIIQVIIRAILSMIVLIFIMSLILYLNHIGLEWSKKQFNVEISLSNLLIASYIGFHANKIRKYIFND